MGLPMFQEPDDVIAEDAASKLDRAAAQQRSTIRRQATVRPGRYQHSERERRAERRRAEERSSDLHYVAQIETEPERLRSIRVRQHNRMDRGYGSFREAMDLLRHGRERSGDVEENETATRASSPVRRLPRPMRESGLRFEVSAPRSGSGSVSPHRLRLLSPPSSSEDSRNVRDGQLEEIPTPPPESWESSYPPLRRVGRLSPRPARVDGLGDRRRSPSPDAEEETWVTMLTTMDDTRSNSAATSFASSVGRSRSSQNTFTSFGEIGQADDGCDLDLPSGITEDDVREIREEHRRERRRQPDGPLSTAEAPARQGLRQHEQGLRQHEQRRTRRVELGLFQDILERMQRREEIPDEWWAAVGLTPIT
ncbi:hypothetical protein DV737_g5501, partial [Chaetothyriales sp. CBS 132003]